MTSVKHRLYSAADKNMQTITMAAANINITFGSDLTDQQYEDIIQEVIRMKHRASLKDIIPVTRNPPAHITPITDHHNWKARYKDAHKLHCQTEYPNVWREGHYAPLTGKEMPDVTTHNGLVKFMANMIKWLGGNSRTHNVVARVTDTVTTEASGNQFKDKRYTKSSRKGVADVQGTLKGISLQMDAKVGRDKPRPDQLKEQVRQRKAGGIYEFIHSTDEFFNIIDPLMYG